MRRLLACLMLVLGVLSASPTAWAQDPFGPGIAPMGGQQDPKAKAKAKAKAPPPGTPELHAAGGGESLLPAGSEPSLPKIR